MANTRRTSSTYEWPSKRGQVNTKAAKRAVEDAFRHSTLSIFQSLGLDSAQMEVRVTVGVSEPEKVDCAAVAAILPRGNATVTAVKGGQNIDDPGNGTAHIIATAAVEALYPVVPENWKLS